MHYAIRHLPKIIGTVSFKLSYFDVDPKFHPVIIPCSRISDEENLLLTDYTNLCPNASQTIHRISISTSSPKIPSTIPQLRIQRKPRNDCAKINYSLFNLEQKLITPSLPKTVNTSHLHRTPISPPCISTNRLGSFSTKFAAIRLIRRRCRAENSAWKRGPAIHCRPNLWSRGVAGDNGVEPG